MAARSRTLRRRAVDGTIARVFRMPRGHHDYSVTPTAVPMRDGVELLTDVYAPEAQTGGTVLIRTPYGRSGPIAHLTAGYLASHGHHVVNQSCRGTAGSGGLFQPFRHEVSDGADTVTWLRRQPWFGGRFAVWGASYVGYTAWAVMTEPCPELAAAVVAATAHDNHWFSHAGGAFALEDVVCLLDGLGHLEGGLARSVLRSLTAGRRLAPAFAGLPLTRVQDTLPEGRGLPYRHWLEATTAADPLWQQPRLDEALDRVDVPVLLQDGWQDRFLEQVLEQYARLSSRGVEVALTVGPWTHGAILTRGASIVMAEALDWFAEHLTGTAGQTRPGPVRIRVTGVEEWRRCPQWPPASQPRVLYLQPHGGLGESRPEPGAGPSTFTYDPAEPTPSVGGRTLSPGTSGYRDNRRLERRADVLTFTTKPLDEPVEVVGSPVVELAHRTDNPHADLFVRLCDVSSSGKSVNVSDGFRRLDPQQAQGTVSIRLEAVAHCFGPRSRIRLQVSGGAHPRYARNLGTDEDPATGTGLAPSRRQVCHGEGGLSAVLLPCPV